MRLAAHALLRHPLDSFELVQSVHRPLLAGLRGGRYTFATDDQLVALAVTVLRLKVRLRRRLREAGCDDGM